MLMLSTLCMQEWEICNNELVYNFVLTDAYSLRFQSPKIKRISALKCRIMYKEIVYFSVVKYAFVKLFKSI